MNVDPWHSGFMLTGAVVAFLEDATPCFNRSARAALDAWCGARMHDAAASVPNHFHWRLQRALRRGKLKALTPQGRALLARSGRRHYVAYKTMPWLRRREHMPAAVIAALYPKPVVFYVEWRGVFRGDHCCLPQIPGWAIQKHTYFKVHVSKTLERLAIIYSGRARVPRSWLSFCVAATNSVIQDHEVLWRQGVDHAPSTSAPGLFVSMNLPPELVLVNLAMSRSPLINHNDDDGRDDDRDDDGRDDDGRDDDDRDDDGGGGGNDEGSDEGSDDGSDEDGEHDDGDRSAWSHRSLHQPYTACGFGFYAGRLRDAATCEEHLDPGRPLHPKAGWLFRVPLRALPLSSTVASWVQCDRLIENLRKLAAHGLGPPARSLGGWCRVRVLPPPANGVLRTWDLVASA